MTWKVSRRRPRPLAAVLAVALAMSLALSLAVSQAVALTAAPTTAALPSGPPAQASAQQALVAASVPQARPNIVLITTDDQTVADLSVMARTRRLLVDEGTSFTNSYTPFSLCCPDRASILTGQYAHNHGVLGNGGEEYPQGGIQQLDLSKTVATWLSEVGYQTAFVGKFLNGYGPAYGVPPGWEDWHGGLEMLDYYNTSMYENGAMTAYPGIYQTDVLADISSRIIAQRVPDSRPLFLWASFFAPHAGERTESDDPVGMATPQVAARHRDAFAGLPLPQDPSFNPADVSDKPAHIRALRKLSAEQVDKLTEAHQQRLESLLAVDEAVGRIVGTLEATGELDNTVILFTSDNGFMMGQFRVKQGKVLPYEPSIRVPLVARGPGFPAGAVRTQPTATMDLTSTIIGLSGARRGLAQDGISLLSLAADPTKGATRDIVLEAGPQSVGGPMFFTGLRTADDWTYVEYADGEAELYDDEADPFQLVNLAGTAAQAGRQAALRLRLARMRDCTWAGCLPAADRPEAPAVQPPPPQPSTPFQPTQPGPVALPAGSKTHVVRLGGQPRVGGRARFEITVSSAAPVGGEVEITMRGKPVKRVAMSGSKVRVGLGRFTRARRTVVRIAFLGAPGVAGSGDVLRFRVRPRT